MKSWPSVYIGMSGVRPASSPKSYSKRPWVSVGHDSGSTAISRTPSSGTNGNAIPPRLDPPPQGAITTSGSRSPASCQLLLGLQPDHGLVQQHVVEDGPERVVGVGAPDAVAHRVGDRAAQRAGVVGLVDR